MNKLSLGAAAMSATLLGSNPSEAYISDIFGAPESSSLRTSVQTDDGAFQVTANARERLAVCDPKLSDAERHGTLHHAEIDLPNPNNISTDLQACLSEVAADLQEELKAIGNTCTVNTTLPNKCDDSSEDQAKLAVHCEDMGGWNLMESANR